MPPPPPPSMATPRYRCRWNWGGGGRAGIRREIKRNKGEGGQRQNYAGTPPPERSAPSLPPPSVGELASLTTRPLMPKVTLSQLPPNYYSSTSPLSSDSKTSTRQHPNSAPLLPPELARRRRRAQSEQQARRLRRKRTQPELGKKERERRLGEGGRPEEKGETPGRGGRRPVLVLRGFVLRKEAVKCF